MCTSTTTTNINIPKNNEFNTVEEPIHEYRRAQQASKDTNNESIKSYGVLDGLELEGV